MIPTQISQPAGISRIFLAMGSNHLIILQNA